MQLMIKDKYISIFLILCLLLAVLPAPAMAADSGPNIPLFQTTDGLAVIEAEDTYFASEVFSAVSGGDMSGGKGIYTSKGPLNPDKIVEESEIPIEKPVNMAFQVKAVYPKGKVSPIQECQFTTLGQNITALEVDGTFDDCQALVKSAFMEDRKSVV